MIIILIRTTILYIRAHTRANVAGDASAGTALRLAKGTCRFRQAANIFGTELIQSRYCAGEHGQSLPQNTPGFCPRRQSPALRAGLLFCAATILRGRTLNVPCDEGLRWHSSRRPTSPISESATGRHNDRSHIGTAVPAVRWCRDHECIDSATREFVHHASARHACSVHTFFRHN